LIILFKHLPGMPPGQTVQARIGTHQRRIYMDQITRDQMGLLATFDGLLKQFQNRPLPPR